MKEVHLNISEEKKIFESLKQCEDIKQFRAGISQLYKTVLELTDQILSLQEQRDELKHERELLSDQNWQQEQRISTMLVELSSERQARQDGVNRIAGLEATATTLTEWNTSLEQQCATLLQSQCQQREISNQMRGELQQDLITATKKLIDLRSEVDQMEEENVHVRRALRESMDIQEKLNQENAILKSKMYSISMGQVDGTPLTMSTVKTSPEFAPKMEDICLNNQLGIGDLLKTLKRVTLR